MAEWVEVERLGSFIPRCWNLIGYVVIHAATSCTLMSRVVTLQSPRRRKGAKSLFAARMVVLLVDVDSD
jgi:hypothetical protein